MCVPFHGVFSQAFAPAANRPAFSRSPTLNGVPLANGAMEFDRVCREWRCKYTGDKATSESLEASKCHTPCLENLCWKPMKSIHSIVRVWFSAILSISHVLTISSTHTSTVSKVVDEYLPTIKGISDGVKVNRLVCGSCLDFKLMITVPLDDFGPWEESGHPPEAEFLEKLKAIDGVSQVETQTITNVEI